MKQQALEAFKATVTVFEDQLKLHVTFRNQAMPHEMNKYVCTVCYVAEQVPSTLVLVR